MRQAVARHPIIWYTLARLVLLAVVLVPLALLGVRGVALLGLGILISGGISLFALDGVRAGFSGQVSGYFSRLNQRIDDAARAEDADLDAAESAGRSADHGQAQA